MAECAWVSGCHELPNSHNVAPVDCYKAGRDIEGVLKQKVVARTRKCTCCRRSRETGTGLSTNSYRKTGLLNLLVRRKQCMNDTDVSRAHDAESCVVLNANLRGQ